MRFDLQRPDCATAMESLWEFLDAELSPGSARAVGAHFDSCGRCGPCFVAAIALKRVIRRTAGCAAPASLRERTRRELL